MRSKERGSVIGFVLGGILLLALLVGGIMLYKNNISKLTGVTADNNQVANNDADSQAAQKAAEEKAAADQAAQNEAALKQQQEAEKKAQEQNKAANSNTGNGTTQNATQVPHTATAPTQALPQTGPASDAAMAALGVSLMIGATSAYYRSRAAL